MGDNTGFFTGRVIFAIRVSDGRDEAAAAVWGYNAVCLILGGARVGSVFPEFGGVSGIAGKVG